MVLDEADLSKSILKLTLPSVAEQVLMMVVGVASTIFVGRIGKEAISAVGLINVLAGFLMALFVALSTGATVLVARLIGEEEVDRARETIRQSVFLGLVSSFLLSILCYIFSVPIIHLFFSRADNEVIQLADIYFRITLYTFPLTLVNIIISGSLRGAGDTKTPMMIAYAVNVINILLSIVLIFGVNVSFIRINGFGISGAAWAVAVSRGLGGILSVAALFGPKNILRLKMGDRLYIDMELIKRMLKVGIPAAMEQIVMQGGFLVLQVVISGMGTAAIAVYQIGMSINSICFIPIWGFGIAATTLIGQSLGARKPELAAKAGWKTLKMGVLVSIALTIGVFLFVRFLVGAYSRDTEVVSLGITAIRIFSISQPFLAVVCIVSGALRGAGDILYVMITSFIGIWAFRIVLSIAFNLLFGWGIIGVWIALCIDFFIRAIMYLVRFKRGRWKAIVV